MLSAGFRKQSNFGRVMIFFLQLELMAIGMGVSYYVRTMVVTDAFYQGMNTFWYIAILAFTFVFRNHPFDHHQG